jgi:transcriptional regulator with XRE-family HTH domain
MNIHFGLKIRELMEKNGHTYREAEKATGIPASNLNNHVKSSDINTKTLRKLAVGYQVPMTYFFEEKVIGSHSQRTDIVNDSGIVYSSQRHTVGGANKETSVKDERIRGLEKEVELLRQMVDILQKK